MTIKHIIAYFDKVTFTFFHLFICSENSLYFGLFLYFINYFDKATGTVATSAKKAVSFQVFSLPLQLD